MHYDGRTRPSVPSHFKKYPEEMQNVSSFLSVPNEQVQGFLNHIGSKTCQSEPSDNARWSKQTASGHLTERMMLRNRIISWIAVLMLFVQPCSPSPGVWHRSGIYPVEAMANCQHSSWKTAHSQRHLPSGDQLRILLGVLLMIVALYQAPNCRAWSSVKSGVSYTGPHEIWRDMFTRYTHLWVFEGLMLRAQRLLIISNLFWQNIRIRPHASEPGWQNGPLPTTPQWPGTGTERGANPFTHDTCQSLWGLSLSQDTSKSSRTCMDTKVCMLATSASEGLRAWQHLGLEMPGLVSALAADRRVAGSKLQISSTHMWCVSFHFLALAYQCYTIVRNNPYLYSSWCIRLYSKIILYPCALGGLGMSLFEDVSSQELATAPFGMSCVVSFRKLRDSSPDLGHFRRGQISFNWNM